VENLTTPIRNTGRQTTRFFVATATAGDEEIGRQNRRPSRQIAHANWQTLEAPLKIGQAIQETPPLPWVLLTAHITGVSNIMMTCSEPLDEQRFHNRVEQKSMS
jgi:adenosyl cobinamide kinase/adenosyl cobinamide phosphate guanylyltransferase